MSKGKKIIVSASILILFIFVVLISIIWFIGLSPGYDENTCYNIPETAFPSQMDSVVKDCIGYIYI